MKAIARTGYTDRRSGASSVSVLTLIAGLLVFPQCGSESPTAEVIPVTAQLTLNFPDGIDVTATGLPAGVTDVGLVAISFETSQVELADVPLDTLTTTLPLSAADDFTFHVIVAGDTGYVGNLPAVLSPGQGDLDLTVDLVEGSPTTIENFTISSNSMGAPAKADLYIDDQMEKYDVNTKPGGTITMVGDIKTNDPPSVMTLDEGDTDPIVMGESENPFYPHQFTVKWTAPADAKIGDTYLIQLVVLGFSDSPFIASVKVHIVQNWLSVEAKASPNPALVGEEVEFSCVANSNTFPGETEVQLTGDAHGEATGINAKLEWAFIPTVAKTYQATCTATQPDGNKVEETVWLVVENACLCEHGKQVNVVGACNWPSGAFECQSWWDANGKSKGPFKNKATATIDGCNLVFTCL